MDADPVRLAQVVGNLLDNAAKYTPPGGPDLAERSSGEGGEVVLRVRDTGIGIAPELLPRVFDLFVQVDRSLARSQGGLGIGLTLVKRLVEMHGGSVEAHSDGPGKGSEFIVRLPALAEASERADAPRHAAAGRTRLRQPRRVLVVDDNVDAAESLAMLLRGGGTRSASAYDGPSALRGGPDLPARRRAARHRHAGDGRLRGRPADPAAAGGGNVGPGRPDRLGAGGGHAGPEGPGSTTTWSKPVDPAALEKLYRVPGDDGQ